MPLEFKDHFSRLAADYASFRPRYPAALFDFLAQSCRQHGCAWDCACGNGQAAVDLAARFASVIATDASAAQIAAAPARANVSYRVAPAEASGLQGASVDLVTVAQALHWLELTAFYAEVERVLRPGGVLAVWTYGIVHIAGERADALLQQFYGVTVQPYWPSERKLVESGYRTLSFPFPEITAPPFTMQEQWSLAQLLGYIRSWSASARYVERNGIDPTVMLEADLLPTWGDPASFRSISWPLSLRVGVKP
jgi:SAM-dependent methyltransferase